MYNGDPAIDLIHYIWAQEKYDERTDNAWVFLALVTGLPVVDEEENSASDDDADNDTDADADADAESGSADSDAADNDADADANADADSDSDPDSADSNAELGDSAAADPTTADSADAPRPANDTDVATAPDSAADAAAAAGSAIADSAADATASFTTTNFPWPCDSTGRDRQGGFDHRGGFALCRPYHRGGFDRRGGFVRFALFDVVETVGVVHIVRRWRDIGACDSDDSDLRGETDSCADTSDDGNPLINYPTCANYNCNRPSSRPDAPGALCCPRCQPVSHSMHTTSCNRAWIEEMLLDLRHTAPSSRAEPVVARTSMARSLAWATTIALSLALSPLPLSYSVPAVVLAHLTPLVLRGPGSPAHATWI